MSRPKRIREAVRSLAGTALASVMLMAGSGSLGAAEYFVAKRGVDTNDGLSRGKPFLTVRKGVEALGSGDTLTIGPGEYFESVESRLAGDRNKRTLIRAEIPGTVCLRGDEDVSGFTQSAAGGAIWELNWPGRVEAVNEVDSFTIYSRRATLASLEFYSGSWFHDAKAARLYIRTSDSLPPRRHRITIVRRPAFGLKLDDGGKATHSVTIDGLAFSGFNSRDQQPWRPGYFTTWGLYINGATDCAVRNCTAFLNGGGIAFGHAERSVIEKCTAYGNYAHESPGGGIVIFGPAKDCIIRQCVARDSERAGIRFYAGTLENCVIRDCVAWNNAYGNFWLKGVHKGNESRYERCVTPGDMQSTFVTTRNCVAGRYADFSREKNDEFNLLLGKTATDAAFADPGRLDYRPQVGAAFLKQAPDGGDRGLPFKGNVFFLKPDGNDAASGDSVVKAWRTLEHAAGLLKAGQTLYFLPGRYPGGNTLRLRGKPEAPIVLRGRSGGPVVFEGGICGLKLVDSAHVILENLNWVGYTNAGLELDAVQDVHVTHCGFDGPIGMEAGRSSQVRATQNAFSNPVSLQLTHVDRAHLAGNIFRGPIEMPPPSLRSLYSDYNNWTGNRSFHDGKVDYDLAGWRQMSGQDGYSCNHDVTFTGPSQGDFYIADNSALTGRGPLGMLIGPYHLRREAKRTDVLTAGVRSVTATTANLEWNCFRNDAGLVLHWGETLACRNSIRMPGGAALRTVGLTGLQPKKKYYYRLAVEENPRLAITQAPPSRSETEGSRPVKSFSTPPTDPEPHTYHVATDGNNSKDGLGLKTAWRTVAYAAGQVRAGDTVQVHGGEYVEEIIVRATGDAGRPITFRRAPGSKVTFSGDRFLATIWSLRHKSHIVLDGFDFVSPGQGAMRGVVDIRHSGGIKVERCLYDGRGGNNPSFIKSVQTDGVALHNNVLISGFFGINISGCRDYLIRNNVFYINSVVVMHVMGDEAARFVMENNLFYDMINMKLRNALFYFHEGRNSIRDQHNCYYVRLPGDVRDIYNLGPGPDRQRLTLEQFCRATDQPETSFFANPRAKALGRLWTYASMDRYLKRKGVKGGNEFRYDRKTRTYEPFDRSEFVPTHAGCREAPNGRPIGLDPEAFKEP